MVHILQYHSKPGSLGQADNSDNYYVDNFGSTEKPDPPIQVEAQDPTSKSITVTWKAPDYDGGCPIQGYIVEKIEKDGDRYEKVTPSLVPGFSYVVTGLKEEMEYQFRVRAENAAGVSEPSRSTQLVKAADPVGMKIYKCVKITC